MMKRLFPFIALFSLMISGCNKPHSIEPMDKGPHYNEVESLHIEWKDLFNQENNQYYVYAYSITCTPCSSLREQVVEYSQKETNHLYFVYPSDDISFTNDPSLADSSLGSTTIENVYVYTTPTLIEITAKEITFYSRDYHEIQNLLK